MAKTKSKYFCKECGYESSGWMGRCPACGAWNSFTEALVQAQPKARGSWVEAEEGQKLPLAMLEDVSGNEQIMRLSTGISELDRVLGGGLVKSSLILIGGDPGIGKSTLLLQVSANLAAKGNTLLYVSGEESAGQIRMRSDRLGLDPKGIKLLTATNFNLISQEIQKTKPDFVVIDSIQTVYNPEIPSAPGTVSQVRDSTGGLLRLAKGLGTTIILLGHVTKDGSIAGPRILEHMVDTVLYFEGEQVRDFRILRCVKNRFGKTDELGLFEMKENGLISVKNPSLAMLTGRPLAVPGVAISSLLEGSRPILVEIQALLTQSHYQTALRMSQGLDRLRLNMLLAVLEKKLKLELYAYDCYVNTVGAVKISETSCDLAVVAAIISSLKEQSIPADFLILGEVGLNGEIRAVGFPEKRVKEAARLGWKNFVLPASSEERVEQMKAEGALNIFYVSNIAEAIDLLFNRPRG